MTVLNAAVILRLRKDLVRQDCAGISLLRGDGVQSGAFALHGQSAVHAQIVPALFVLALFLSLIQRIDITFKLFRNDDLCQRPDSPINQSIPHNQNKAERLIAS